MVKIIIGKTSHADDDLIYSIQTTSQDEERFIDEYTEALLKLINKAFQEKNELVSIYLLSLLPLMVDICCKMRGYKSSVNEKRLLTAGAVIIEEEEIYES